MPWLSHILTYGPESRRVSRLPVTLYITKRDTPTLALFDQTSARLTCLRLIDCLIRLDGWAIQQMAHHIRLSHTHTHTKRRFVGRTVIGKCVSRVTHTAYTSHIVSHIVHTRLLPLPLWSSYKWPDGMCSKCFDATTCINQMVQRLNWTNSKYAITGFCRASDHFHS